LRTQHRSIQAIQAQRCTRNSCACTPPLTVCACHSAGAALPRLRARCPVPARGPCGMARAAYTRTTMRESQTHIPSNASTHTRRTTQPLELCEVEADEHAHTHLCVCVCECVYVCVCLYVTAQVQDARRKVLGVWESPFESGKAAHLAEAAAAKQGRCPTPDEVAWCVVMKHVARNLNLLADDVCHLGFAAGGKEPQRGVEVGHAQTVRASTEGVQRKWSFSSRQP